MAPLRIVGGVSVDHIVAEGVGARFGLLGGPGFYASLGARLVAGTEVGLDAELPADEPRFAAELAGRGVDLGRCRTVPAAVRAWLLTDRGGRVVVPAADGNGPELVSAAPLADEPAPASDLAGVAGALLSSPDLPPSLWAEQVTGIDPHQLQIVRRGWDYLAGFRHAGALLLPSRLQLRLLDADVAAVARRIAADLAIPIVARLDADGMLVAEGGRSWLVRDPAARVLETTGAGDASAGAIVAAVAAGHPLPVAAAFGISVARLAISDWGAAGLLAAQPLDQPFDEVIVEPL